MNTEKSSEAVRAARRELFGKVRNDWDEALERIIPSIPDNYLPYQWRPELANSQTIDPQVIEDRQRYPFRNATKAELETAGAEEEEDPYLFLNSFDTAGGDAEDWRERTYAPSDPSSAEDSEGYVAGADGIFRKLRLSSKDEKPSARSSKDKINGQGLDEDQESTDPEDEHNWSSLSKEEKKKLRRTKRRRKRQQAEMKWNSGLRYWEMRRDIWCCAKPRATSSMPDSQVEPVQSSNNPADQVQSESDHQAVPSQSASSTSHTTNKIPSMILPVAPPLLRQEEHKRPNISPAAFPSIYNKLVTQSLSPSVPLNLSAVVPALVEGWKANGEWPTGTPADPTLSVNMTANPTPDKRSSMPGSGLTAIADATKSGLRALGGKPSTNGTSKKPDPNPTSTTRGKLRLRANHDLNHTSHKDAEAQEASKTTSPTASKQKASNHNRNSSTSTPDSFAPQLAPGQDVRPEPDAANAAAGGASAGTGSTSGSTHEAASPRRVRKGVARVGKAIKDGFTVSPAAADG